MWLEKLICNICGGDVMMINLVSMCGLCGFDVIWVG